MFVSLQKITVLGCVLIAQLHIFPWICLFSGKKRWGWEGWRWRRGRWRKSRDSLHKNFDGDTKQLGLTLSGIMVCLWLWVFICEKIISYFLQNFGSVLLHNWRWFPTAHHQSGYLMFWRDLHFSFLAGSLPKGRRDSIQSPKQAAHMDWSQEVNGFCQPVSCQNLFPRKFLPYNWVSHLGSSGLFSSL